MTIKSPVQLLCDCSRLLCRPGSRCKLQVVRFFVFFFLLFSFAVSAQSPNRQQIISSYLYNFARHIEWPQGRVASHFELAVYGVDDPLLLAELNRMAESVRLEGKPIRVSRLTSLQDIARYQMVFLAAANNAQMTDIYRLLNSQPVVLVTEDYNNQQLVMINLLPTPDGRLRFEVNKSNLINHGLNPLPELILNGGTEIDVAQLYREGQASLIELQQQLQRREASLNRLSEHIEAQEKVNQRLEQQLTSLNESIQKSDALIARQMVQMREQQGQISASEAERNKLLGEVEVRNQELTELRQNLDRIGQEIAAREERLGGLNDTIARQESEILKQQRAIAGLDQQVDTQKAALRYLAGVVFLGILLIITVLVAYVVKRRDNQRLAARSQDLQMARDRLAIAKRRAEDASQAKSEFLSLMSHELRTPLQAIIGYTEVVIEDLRLVDDQAHVGDLQRVINNSERLLKLINGVLDLAKIESGRMELDLTEIKLSALVDEALSAVEPLMKKNGIKVRLNVNDGAYLPLADPEKLLHILINLLGNASKFSPRGEVVITALHEPQRIFISVSDTGIGLTQEQQQQIFDPFRQVDTSTRKFHGSGLGLSITRQLCEMMGGSIEVESELGKGATFTVILPLPIELHQSFGGMNADDDSALDDGEVAPGALGQHIVMIDDDPAFLDIMARTMRREGYQVHTAADAETGFRLVQSIRPQVVTLDLLLPDQHGWFLFEKIKADPELQEIPVIIISIMDERRDENKHQAEDYLTKPIRRETLRMAVQRLMPDSKQ